MGFMVQSGVRVLVSRLMPRVVVARQPLEAAPPPNRITQLAMPRAAVGPVAFKTPHPHPRPPVRACTRALQAHSPQRQQRG